LRPSAIIIERNIVAHNPLINYSNDYRLLAERSFNDEQTQYLIR